MVQVYGKTFGLSREEWRMIFLLAEAGQLSSLELARRTTLDKVQVSRAAKRLEEKGLIARHIADSDRRLRIYTCTDKGRSLFQQALPAVQHCANSILSKMSTEDKAKLVDGLSALAKAIDAFTDDPEV
nr:MarR family transcriptional regulator [Tritonibacter litoralis]